MFPLTHLSLKIFPNGTAFDVIFIDSPIFNRNIVHRVLNMTQWEYSITTTNSNKGSIDTTNLPQRMIGQWKTYITYEFLRRLGLNRMSYLVLSLQLR
jgi:hypothetical protein